MDVCGYCCPTQQIVGGPTGSGDAYPIGGSADPTNCGCGKLVITWGQAGGIDDCNQNLTLRWQIEVSRCANDFSKAMGNSDGSPPALDVRNLEANAFAEESFSMFTAVRTCMHEAWGGKLYDTVDNVLVTPGPGSWRYTPTGTYALDSKWCS